MYVNFALKGFFGNSVSKISPSSFESLKNDNILYFSDEKLYVEKRVTIIQRKIHFLSNKLANAVFSNLKAFQMSLIFEYN